MITFTSQLDFERAVMEVLKEHLHLKVTIDQAQRFLSEDTTIGIKVKLGSEYHGDITEASDNT